MARPASSSAPSQRQLRVAELIRRALSEIFARGDLHVPGVSGASLTVGEVRTSPDLKQATVFVLPLGGDGAEETIAELNAHRGEIRHAVTKAVTLKFSPQLRFLVDESFDQMDATRRLLADPVVSRDVALGAEGEE